MRKSWILWCVVILTAAGIIVAQQPDDTIKETVQVVNVEVPVRVYHKGKPVDSLTKNDFRLYEKRKLQNINGCILKRKKIKTQDINMTAGQTKTPAPRFFVFVFRITDYNDDLKKGIEHLFEVVLKESDQILVFVNNRTIPFPDLKNKTSVKEQIQALLQEESMQARNEMMVYLKAIENELNMHEFEMNIKSRGMSQPYHQYVNNFLNKYIMIWRDYKKNYLMPDINKYYNFAKFLKKIRGDKWVINFFQMEMFPQIALSGYVMRRIKAEINRWQTADGPDQGELLSYARIVSRQLIDIEKEANLAKDFPSAELAGIFHNVDTTFHSIFMRSPHTTLAQDVEYQQIASELENSIRDITDRTGGEFVVSNEIVTAIDTIREAEDIYYLLTYAPRDPEKVGNIKIKLNNRKYKLIYSPNIRSGYSGENLEKKEIKGSQVRIGECQFKNSRLTIAISDHYWQKNQPGRLTIRIQIKNRQGIAIFDQKKQVKATQGEIKIAMNITGIKKGNYDIVVDVEDLLTRKTATEITQIKITK